VKREKFDKDLQEIYGTLESIEDLPANHALSDHKSVEDLKQIERKVLKLRKDFQRRLKISELSQATYKNNKLDWPSDSKLNSIAVSGERLANFVRLPLEYGSLRNHSDLSDRQKVHHSLIYLLRLIFRNDMVIAVPEYLDELSRLGIKDLDKVIRPRLSRFKKLGFIAQVEGASGFYTIPLSILTALEDEKYYELEADMNAAMAKLMIE